MDEETNNADAFARKDASSASQSAINEAETVGSVADKSLLDHIPRRDIPSDKGAIDDNLISEIATHINFLFPSSIISRIDRHNLIILVSDRTMETISTSVDDLHRNLNELLAIWQNNSQSIKFNIALLEINADNSDAVALIDAARAACQMAKQKINFKTFW